MQRRQSNSHSSHFQILLGVPFSIQYCRCSDGDDSGCVVSGGLGGGGGNDKDAGRVVVGGLARAACRGVPPS